MSHIKRVNIRKGGRGYELEVDAEDHDNLILQTVTLIDGPRVELEHDVDPTVFEDGLDSDDWREIRLQLNL